PSSSPATAPRRTGGRERRPRPLRRPRPRATGAAPSLAPDQSLPEPIVSLPRWILSLPRRILSLPPSILSRATTQAAEPDDGGRPTETDHHRAERRRSTRRRPGRARGVVRGRGGRARGTRIADVVRSDEPVFDRVLRRRAEHEIGAERRAREIGLEA